VIFFDKIRNLDKSISYFVYCRSGRRSLEACYMMYEFGFNDVYNLKNGILGWKGEIVRG